MLKTVHHDIVIIGAGGAGLRAAIEIASESPELKVALLSKVYPMRSHTVAAEGGAAGVAKDEDNLEHHFNDTVSGETGYVIRMPLNILLKMHLKN